MLVSSNASRALPSASGKLTIKPLERVPKISHSFETETLNKLRTTIAAVHGKKDLPGGAKEEAYRAVEAMCVIGMDFKLAQFLRTECDNHIRAKLSAVSAQASSIGPSGNSGGDALLRAMHAVWQDHCDATKVLSELFTYLDRTYILTQHQSGSSEPCARSLRDVSMQLFRAQLDKLPDVRDKTIQGILRLIDAERRGCMAQNVLHSLVDMLSQLGIYKSNFEQILVERTAQFFRSEAESSHPKLSVADYLKHCEKRLADEAARCEAHFEKQTATMLLERARAELLRRHCESLLESGFSVLVKEHKVDDLERLYRLFSQIDALPQVRKTWCSAIKMIGKNIMKLGEDAEESKSVVPSLLDMHAKLNEILANSFQRSNAFAHAMKDAFEEILSAEPQNLPAKLLARHVDEVLRNERACSESELEVSIESIVGIFRFVAAKDVFEAFYKKDLAKRLLLGRSQSHDAEQIMIQKLKDECGSGFTSKLEGMFRDVDVSKTVYDAFAAKPEIATLLNEISMESSVSVLTSGLWPTQPLTPSITYPAGPKSLQDAFSSFYSSQYTGRSVRWSPTLGQCTLRASYDGGVRKELIVSHFQAIVLLLFNSANYLTCEQIASQTGLTGGDLHRTLQSLALHKTVKLLTKEPKSREVADKDVFTYNGNFSHKMYRIVVTQITPKEVTEEEAGVEQRVFEDRQHEVDAAIVRIMKVKKTQSHQQLMTDVFAAMSFPASAADVKRRVESLIEREYLERDAERPSTYNYLA